ncbi:2-iminoacetate synthase ThiH [Deltaproteobacteria bacterium Smac51]|nr:2-iminoacetate synthase ThiH [Deltaproteobacteria bacterium Smac51]
MNNAELMMEQVKAVWNFDFEAVTSNQVHRALAKERLALDDLGVLLSPAGFLHIEEMALKAREVTARFFGRNIALYTPLYIANHCVNECSYCGYNLRNHIRRAKLSFKEIETEAEAIAATGLTEILLLTGESRVKSDVDYIAGAVKILARHFRCVGIEVYPMNVDEYRQIQQAGADYVSVYQETYDPDLYDRVHLSGPKKDYAWRFGANQRALEAGFRGVSFGALLGLGDFRRDVLATGAHAELIARKYPQAEISFSTPRLRPFPNQEKNESHVGEAELAQVILALRLFMPWAGLSLSTRERAEFRDHLIGLGITRLSAGVETGVGGHSGEGKGDEQFHKSDGRSVEEVRRAIAAKGCQPVFNDYVRV